MKNLKSFAFIVLGLISLSSCNNDDDRVVPVNEEEVITTVRVTLMGGGQTITLTSRDLDGDGPNAPVVTVSGNLVAGTTYTGATTFLNELKSPADDITVEVQQEGAEHQVFYQLPSTLGTITYNPTDVDANGKPIGLKFALVAGSIGNGNLTVTLRHNLNKAAAGVASGNSANAGGSTDALVSFPIVVN